MKTMAQIINDEIAEATYTGRTHFVCNEKRTPKIKFNNYFILITRMFNRFGYQTWKDNHLFDYERCHLENAHDAELNAKLEIISVERIFNLTKKK